MSKSRGINRPKAIWTDAQIEQVRARYPHEKTERIARDIGMRLEQVYRQAQKIGLKKTREYLNSPDACRLRCDSPGAAFRFPKGHVPANKGKRTPGYAPGRMGDTQFKKGRHPHTWKPIGSHRFSTERYLQRKLTDTGYPPRDWKGVHIILWEQHNGPVPDGHIITFKDQDKTNIVIENLECISRIENMKRNTIHNLPPELKEVCKLQGALNRRITCHERRKRTQKTPV